MRITAVVTAYHPDARLEAVVASALESCQDVVIVDNTPTGSPSSAGSGEGALGDDRVRVLRSGRNAGLGGALNAGLAAVPPEADAVLLLDQDSVLTKELVLGLAAHLEADASVGIASPAPWDAESDSHYESLSAARYGTVSDRDAVITSGMLIRRSCLAEVPGGFREDFFLDYVDLDYCLKLRRKGVRIIQDKSLQLAHSIGDRRTHRVGPVRVPVIHYPAFRHYWIGRNGTILIRENRRVLKAWSFRTFLYLVRWVAVTALFEKNRVACVSAFVRGVRDARGQRLTERYLPAGAEYPAPGPDR
jgi:rhamnosyltransferase